MTFGSYNGFPESHAPEWDPLRIRPQNSTAPSCEQSLLATEYLPAVHGGNYFDCGRLEDFHERHLWVSGPVTIMCSPLIDTFFSTGV